jgi:hypothetical protein
MQLQYIIGYACLRPHTKHIKQTNKQKNKQISKNTEPNK